MALNEGAKAAQPPKGLCRNGMKSVDGGRSRESFGLMRADTRSRGNRGRPIDTIADQVAQQDVDQRATLSRAAAGHDVRNQLHAGLGQRFGDLDHGIVAALHRVDLLLDDGGLGGTDRFHLGSFGLADSTDNGSVSFGVDRLGLGLAFGAFHGSLGVELLDGHLALGVDHIESRRALIDNARLCVVDTNLPQAVLDHLLATFDRPDLFLDPVSGVKALKVKDRIGRFHTIKPNRMEAEVLAGISIRDDADLRAAAGILHARGVRRIFISMGGDGVFVSADGMSRRVPNLVSKVVNASGAGDAFMAGLAYAYFRDLPPEEAARAALAASAIAMAGVPTINPRMSEAELRLYLQGEGR